MNQSIKGSCSAVSWCLGASLTICLLTGVLFSQVPRPASKTADELIAKVRTGQFGVMDVNEIANAGAAQAIPVLEAQFDAAEDPLFKKALASALVRLGDRQHGYWDFLAIKANAAIDSDAPYISEFDSEGYTIPRRFSRKFLEWAKAHQVDPNAAAQAQLYVIPGDVLYLAATGDPRGLTILRRGLLNQNYLIQYISARGLALLQDKDSIPLIISACEKAPSELWPLFARPLVFFDDVSAQRAASRFILNRDLLEEFRKVSREKGPQGLF